MAATSGMKALTCSYVRTVETRPNSFPVRAIAD
jgi:hypothetical protein